MPPFRVLRLTHELPSVEVRAKNQTHKISCDLSRDRTEGLSNCAHGSPVELLTLHALGASRIVTFLRKVRAPR
jgi:hypothetical protein